MTDTIEFGGHEYEIVEHRKNRIVAEREPTLVEEAREIAEDVFGDHLVEVKSTEDLGADDHRVVIQTWTSTRAEGLSAFGDINGGVTYMNTPTDERETDRIERNYGLDVTYDSVLIFC